LRFACSQSPRRDPHRLDGVERADADERVSAEEQQYFESLLRCRAARTIATLLDVLSAM
jgi:hypothetical protein